MVALNTLISFFGVLPNVENGTAPTINKLIQCLTRLESKAVSSELIKKILFQTLQIKQSFSVFRLIAIVFVNLATSATFRYT